jgi:hypothetical protein
MASEQITVRTTPGCHRAEHSVMRLKRNTWTSRDHDHYSTRIEGRAHMNRALTTRRKTRVAIHQGGSPSTLLRWLFVQQLAFDRSVPGEHEWLVSGHRHHIREDVASEPANSKLWSADHADQIVGSVLARAPSPTVTRREMHPPTVRA